MIDVLNDDLIPLRDVCTKFSVTYKTARSWVDEGLEACKVGRRWYTTAEALNAFAKRINERQPAETTKKPDHAARHEAAMKALRERHGIG